MKITHFIGVDASKKNLDFALLNQKGETVKLSKMENSEVGIQEYFEGLKKSDSTFQFANTVVCMEHTGIYTNILLDYLAKEETNICLEMALQIKRSIGIQRGKSDKVDAHRIAEYAFAKGEKLRLWQPTRPEVHKLKALLTLRERLVRISGQLEVPLNELGAFVDVATQKMLRKSSDASIKAIKKSIGKADSAIEKLIQGDVILKKQFDLATSVTGIGPVIAANLIATTNEFKTITDPKKYACYAGVAPFGYTSGTSVKVKPHVSNLANMTIKSLLNLGATSAIQHSPEMKAYYERKLAQGKEKMSVINAVRNKLISRVFVCITQQRPYEKIYKHVLA
jgi:transposase